MGDGGEVVIGDVVVGSVVVGDVDVGAVVDGSDVAEVGAGVMLEGGVDVMGVVVPAPQLHP